MRARISLLLMLAVLSVGPGCLTAQFVKPTATFQKSAASATAAIATFYKSRNSFERDVYLADVAADPRHELAFTIDGKPTPLDGLFSPAAIQARLDSLELINVYATRLADLAGSDQPAQFAAATDLLGKNLMALGNTWTTIAGTTPSDSNAAKYVGPTTTLLGLVGQMILATKRDAAVAKAIKDGDPLVRQILNLLNEDLSELSLDNETGARDELASAVKRYNEDRSKLTLPQRTVALEHVAMLASAHATTVGTNPGNLIAPMLTAEAALVKFATSSHTPKDVAELTTVLETFGTRVGQVADAINQLKSKEN